jgi:autotransporter-associated beta strand protein
LAVFSGVNTTGSIHVSGGELQVGRRILIAANATTRTGNLTISGTGKINMVATGSAAEGDRGMLRLGNGVATLNFDGGELIGRGIHQSSATSASKIFYNGTQFTLNGNSGTGVSGLIGSGGAAANQIKDGGLKIDTNGFVGTISKAIGNFTGVSGVLTKSGLGTLNMSSTGNSFSQTVVNGGILNFTVNDAIGNHSGSVHSLTVNAGGLVTNSTAANGFTTFKDLTLNGGELRATNSLSALSGTFQAYHLRDTVTVGGSTASTIADTGQANGAINIGGITDIGGGFGSNAVFSVADATSSAAADLTVSAKFKDSASTTFTLLRTGIDKTGVGTMSLSGVNSYSGNTNIQQGTLALVGGGSIANSAVINVSTGATFDVSATSSAWSLATGQSLVGGGSVAGNVAITGVLAPGSSVGTLSFGGGLTLFGTSSFEIDAVNNLSDLAAVSGSLVFGGILNVLNLGGTLAAGQTFDLFDFNNAQSSGTFSEVNLPSPGPGLTWDTSSLYQSGTIVVAIPEPSAAFLTGMAGLLLLRRRRN